MKKKKVVILIAEIALLAILVLGCPLDEQAIALFGSETAVPEFLGIQAVSKNEVEIEFSSSISISDVSVEPSLSVSAVSTDKNKVSVIFSENTKIGEPYRLSGVVSESGASLSFTVSFLGYNDNVPQLFISEIRTEYSKPKVEFIELCALSDGNLSGVTLITASAGRDSAYSFPNVNVKSGERIVLHMRSISDDITYDLISKTSGSEEAEASSEAWDFWKSGNSEVLRKNDVIILEKSPKGKIIDGVVLAEGTLENWKSDELLQAATLLVDENIWSTNSCADAVLTTTTSGKNCVTLTRTANFLKEKALVFPRSKEFWYICANGGASPGLANSEAVYNPAE